MHRRRGTCEGCCSARGAAGRWDLHHAILYSGGYLEVAEQLGRRCAPRGRPLERHLLTPRQLAAELRAFQRAVGGPPGVLPPRRALVGAGRSDLWQVPCNPAAGSPPPTATTCACHLVKCRCDWELPTHSLRHSQTSFVVRSCFQYSKTAADFRSKLAVSSFPKLGPVVICCRFCRPNPPA